MSLARLIQTAAVVLALASLIAASIIPDVLDSVSGLTGFTFDDELKWYGWPFSGVFSWKTLTHDPYRNLTTESFKQDVSWLSVCADALIWLVILCGVFRGTGYLCGVIEARFQRTQFESSTEQVQ